MGKEVTLEEITEDTLEDVLNLSVTSAQSNFVSTNSVSIAKAHFSHYAWLRAILADTHPVGFVMLYLDGTMPEYFIWRMMIDKKHQGNGYGSEALKQVIELVKSLPEAKELLVRYVPGPGNPSGFFEKFGFEESEKSDDGKSVMKFTLE